MNPSLKISERSRSTFSRNLGFALLSIAMMLSASHIFGQSPYVGTVEKATTTSTAMASNPFALAAAQPVTYGQAVRTKAIASTSFITVYIAMKPPRTAATQQANDTVRVVAIASYVPTLNDRPLGNGDFGYTYYGTFIRGGTSTFAALTNTAAGTYSVVYRVTDTR
jgi:hypothetical protein